MHTVLMFFLSLCVLFGLVYISRIYLLMRIQESASGTTVLKRIYSSSTVKTLSYVPVVNSAIVVIDLCIHIVDSMVFTVILLIESAYLSCIAITKSLFLLLKKIRKKI